ncbi:hypothetical protein QBZ16_001904 [Prototheca wickerhamii]|uniref:Kinesin-like protein n=1 Tax=Prototheca wickerhamii TaxID=3111 RepID=A0AAD9ILN9_PROWI|nr:hypothetical protein QBZ16_001904 [Prototheca wickerhamii]
MSVARILSQADLGHLTTCFSELSLQRFRSLLIQDYEKYGVYEMRDKQALFRLIQSLGSSESLGLDADRHDPEFQSLSSGALMPSPAPAYAEASAAGGRLAPAAPPATEPAPHPIFLAPDPPKIRVIVRKRPLNRKEEDRGDTDVLECDTPHSTLYVNEPKQKVDLTKFIERHTFRFDDVFGEDVDNDLLYATAIRPLISTIFRRGKATCFAYGQTGSGKTYTMQPLPLRAASDIFSVLSCADHSHMALGVSCYEIYGGKLFDLLNERNKLEVREDARRNVQVVGLKEVEVFDLETLEQLVGHSAAARSTGSTGANDESSRSHSIMVFALRNVSNPKRPIVGKLSFIDLAGSERGAGTDTYDNDKQTRLEGAEINKSLLALKECIRALDTDARHIPFRGSKLTEVLRDSFTGKTARTVMIANVSPCSSSCEHTLNTLRYADRVKEIRKPAPGAAAAQQQQQTEAALQLAQALHAQQQQQAEEGARAAAASPARQTSLPRGSITTRAKRRETALATDNIQASRPHEAGADAYASAPQQITYATPPVRRQPAPADTVDVVQSAGPAAAPGARRAAATPPAAASPAAPDTPLDEELSALMRAEDELVASHRQHIEDSMAHVREEMALLGELDDGSGTAGDIEVYASELSNLLAEKAAAVAALQLRVTQFRRLVQQTLDRHNGGPSGGRRGL